MSEIPDWLVGYRRCDIEPLPENHYRCNRCRLIKPQTAFRFYIAKGRYRRRTTFCIQCKKETYDAASQAKSNRRWNERNKKRRQELNKEYYEQHKDYLKTQKTQRRHKSPKLRLEDSIRSAVYRCLKNHKEDRTFKLLGFTIDQLMQHLELMFKDGMNWNNYGQWHVDHKRPLSSLHYTSAEDDNFKLAWSLNNLQPLWAEENIRKGSSFGE